MSFGGREWRVRAAPVVRAVLAGWSMNTYVQPTRLGDQTGGRVFLFLETDDFWGDYNHMLACGVRFTEQPRQESYGTVVVFLDLYGNKWDMIQRNQGNKP